MSFSRSLLHVARIAAASLFWPALILVVWGELDADPERGLFRWLAGLNDKVLHFSAYFGLAALAAFALRSRERAVAAILGLVAMGAVLELLQGFVGRDMSGFDAAANAAGAIFGGAIARGLLEALRRCVPSA
jgi:VanZ family protein